MRKNPAQNLDVEHAHLMNISCNQNEVRVQQLELFQEPMLSWNVSWLDMKIREMQYLKGFCDVGFDGDAGQLGPVWLDEISVYDDDGIDNASERRSYRKAD